MRRSDLSPAQVVTRAYRAANRGRFAEANRDLTAGLRGMMQASARGIQASNHLMTATAPRIASSNQRARVQELVNTLRQFEDPNYCWKGSTQGGSIASIEVMRQTVRKDRAVVTVALRLSDGRVRVERNWLTRKRDGWFIGRIEVEVLQNKELQRTKPAQATELRR